MRCNLQISSLPRSKADLWTEKSRSFVTPGYVNNCSSLQRSTSRNQALALLYSEHAHTDINSHD